MLQRQIQSAVNEGRLVVPQMKIDKNPFPAHTHMLELSNLKVLIRPSQAKSTKRKNVVIGEERSEPSRPSQEIPVKKSSEFSLKKSTLGGGQEQKEGARSVKTSLTGLETDLTGPSGSSAKIPSNKAKQGQALRSSQPNMIGKEPSRSRRDDRIKSRISSHH